MRSTLQNGRRGHGMAQSLSPWNSSSSAVSPGIDSLLIHQAAAGDGLLVSASRGHLAGFCQLHLQRRRSPSWRRVQLCNQLQCSTGALLLV
jgi:hypothetical protein